MDEHDVGASVDAAEVGLALAFPGGLRRQVAALVASWAPVEAAVAAGWLGLDRLRLVTAEVNGSLATPRVLGRGRPAGLGLGVADGGVGRSARAGFAGSVEPGAAAVEVPGFGAGDAGGGVAPGVAAVAVPAGGVAPVVVVSRRDAGGDGEASEVESAEVPRALAPAGVGVTRGGAPSGAAPDAPSGSPLDVGADEAAVLEGGAIAPVDGGGTGGGGGFRADVQAALQLLGRSRGEIGLDEGEYADEGSVDLVAGRSFVPTGVRGGAASGVGGRDAGMTGLAADEAASGVERSAVASSSGGERGGSGGGGDGVSGTITLDGHLVGHWMGDRMARDASRPGAGTTFFDPRQSPAWTPSGAL